MTSNPIDQALAALERVMTPVEFRDALAALGLNQTTAAPALGLDVRTVRRYAAWCGPSARPIPPTVALLLAALMRETKANATARPQSAPVAPA